MHHKVMIIEPVGSSGGMEHLNDMLCRSLVKSGVEVFLATSGGVPANEYRVLNLFKGVFGEGASLLRALRFACAVVHAIGFARRASISIIHLQIFHVGLLQYLTLLAFKLFSFKLVVSAHDVGSYRSGESATLLRWFYSKVDQLIVHSSAAQDRVSDLRLLPSKKVSIIPLGTYEGSIKDKPSKAECCNTLGVDPSKFTILFFGQIKMIKRLDILVDAVSQLNANGRKLQILCAGANLERGSTEYLRALQSKLGAGFICHNRFIPDCEIATYMGCADLSVLPYDDITQSGVLLLMMSYNIPVLVSDIPGMTAVVKHGVTGLTFEKGNSVDLAQTLTNILDLKWDLQRLSSAALDYVRQTTNWDDIGRQTVSVYRDALG